MRGVALESREAGARECAAIGEQAHEAVPPDFR